MANPQMENGYTPICNELLEAIYGTQFTATQIRIILAITRFTYGFSRKEHDLSEGFLSKAIGVSRRNVKRELGKLIEKNVVRITRQHTCSDPRRLALNKDYSQWVGAQISPGGVDIPRGSKYPPGGGVDIPSGGGLDIPQDKQIKQNKKKAIDQIFETIWSQYPLKRGKAAVKQKQKEELAKIGLEEMTRCVERYKSAKEDWRAWQNGSTFFNSGYIDYLDENYTVTEIKPSNHIPYKSAREQIFGEDA